jgi:serine/threonine protein kinase
VKLLDFGLATRADVHAGHATDATISALTGEHKIVGTPQYMVPEQVEGRDADTRTDIFALGCVLYELIAGTRAFAGDSPSAVMAAIIATEPRSMREIAPITPPTLEWIVMRCLAKTPDDRWQTVRDLRAALDRVARRSAVPDERVGCRRVATVHDHRELDREAEALTKGKGKGRYAKTRARGMARPERSGVSSTSAASAENSTGLPNPVGDRR